MDARWMVAPMVAGVMVTSPHMPWPPVKPGVSCPAIRTPAATGRTRPGHLQGNDGQVEGKAADGLVAKREVASQVAMVCKAEVRATADELVNRQVVNSAVNSSRSVNNRIVIEANAQRIAEVHAVSIAGQQPPWHPQEAVHRWQRWQVGLQRAIAAPVVPVVAGCWQQPRQGRCAAGVRTA